MRKFLFLFALLLVFPLCILAEESASLGVDVLIPTACEASIDGGMIDLYCGPTQGFYRHEEQALDLGKPYVFFGQFDCWSMVAQGTPDAFGPVGWVESALLETLPETPELAFEQALSAMVEEDSVITSDPLSISEDTAWSNPIARGEEVIVLAQYGDWLYVQTELNDMPARVFIPISAIL